jgi:NAD dependent epimerase/dehydratase family enzyme
MLSRNPAKVNAGRGVAWDGRTQGVWSEEIANADAIVNLAGENVGEGRWTGAQAKARCEPARRDRRGRAGAAQRASRARGRECIRRGLLRRAGDEELDETASRGGGFLAELVEKWEAARARWRASRAS